MSTYEDRLAGLHVQIEGYTLERRELAVTPEFTRVSTVVRLDGGETDGLGEDVTYDTVDQEALQAAGPALPLAGSYTLEELSTRLDGLDLWPAPPQREASVHYRRWAFESAALDLALRQAGRALSEQLVRVANPVAFLVSLRLGEPPTLDPVLRRLERYPDLRFKLDPTSSWDEELIAGLVGTGAVDSVDLKGFYQGTIVDQPPDPVLYRRVVDAFPHAWIEDPALTGETEPILEPHRDRITWDAPIHSVADIEALPFPPKTINMKPSRFGSLQRLLDAYDHCAERGIAAYGGGQFELGPGRGQVQYLSSLFHPDASNDVAPGGYNDPAVPSGLLPSPLPRLAEPTGFRWG